MNLYNVTLKDGRIVKVQADSYKDEGHKIVFKRNNNQENQFFKSAEVVGISLVPELPGLENR